MLLLSIYRQDIAFGHHGLGSRNILDVIAGKSVVIKILCCCVTVQGTVTVDDVIQLLQQVIKGSVAVALAALAVMAAVAVELERVLLLLHLLLSGFVVVVRPCVGEAHEQRIGQGTVHRSREIRHS